MARPYWSGQIQISLVQFGVKLFVATEAKSDIQFHQIDRATGERVRHQKVLASALEQAPEQAAEQVVQRSQIVKGFEYSKGRYVTIEPEELAHLRVPSKHTMEITQFVDESEIDPEFYEKPYFVIPENDAQAEAFATVRKALAESKKIALSKIAFAGREHVVAIAPAGTDEHPGMMAYTMRYAAELRKQSDYFNDIKKSTIDEDSLGLAKELIKRKTAPFQPEKFVDGYEVAVRELVDAKLKHAPIPQDEAPAPARGKVVNLMDALRSSLGSNAKPEAEEEEEAAPAQRSPASDRKRGLSLVKGGAKAAAKAPATKAKAPVKRKTA
jgi:DNA end-binding protein Ku